MHVGTTMKLSHCSLAETMKPQTASFWFQKYRFFCFARGTKKEIFATDFNTDKFILISRKGRFHLKYFPKAALWYEHPKKLLEEELPCETECVWCFAAGAPVVTHLQVRHRGRGEAGQRGSTGGRASTPWPHSQVRGDNVLVCSHPQTVITQLTISALLASGASRSGGSHYLVVVMDMIFCSDSYANVSGYAFLMDKGTASLILSSVKYFPVASFSDQLEKKRSETYKTLWQHEAIYLVQNPLGLEQEGMQLLLDWWSWLSLCLMCLVQMEVKCTRDTFSIYNRIFYSLPGWSQTTLLLVDLQYCCGLRLF